MKNLMFLAVFVYCFAYFGCGKTENDQKITMDSQNTIAKELTFRTDFNYDTIELQDIEILPINLQQKVFRNITPNKRLELWINRINKAKLSFNQTQKTYLSSIENLLNLNLFSDTLSNSTEQYFNNWQANVISNSIWTQKEVYQLFYSFTPMDSNVIRINFQGGGNDLPDCECSWHEYCSTFGFGDVCGSKCSKTTLGCGLFLLKPCVGLCIFVPNPWDY
ncbi:MAG: bacteriocin fulvocin C-related protein [Deltaproteobacteria bacterium]